MTACRVRDERRDLGIASFGGVRLVLDTGIIAAFGDDCAIGIAGPACTAGKVPGPGGDHQQALRDDDLAGHDVRSDGQSVDGDRARSGPLEVLSCGAPDSDPGEGVIEDRGLRIWRSLQERGRRYSR